MTPSVDLVLFDLGGVLMDFGGVGPMRELAELGSDEEVWRRWLTCRWVRRFERGHCSAEEFAAGMVSDWGLPVSPEAFLASFGGWVGGPLPGADALLATVQQAVPAGCLSNTNVLHWERNAEWPILDAFDFRFLSFELGMVKPDSELFDCVAHLLPCPAGRVLFLDDNALNVDAAAEAGFSAVMARGVAEARQAVAIAGIC